MDLAEALLTIELLHGQLAAQAQQLAVRDEQIASLRADLLRKAFEVARLKRALYGKSSERVVPDMGLFLPGLAPAAANDAPASTEPPTRTVKEHERKVRTDPSRARLELDPSCVTDEHVTLLPDVTACGCCGGALVALSEELRTVVERQPAHYLRTIFHRPKLACAQCGGAGVVIAPAPEPTVTGAGPVGLSLAVDTVLMHYQDHLPFHRMAGIFLREGMRIDRSTLSRVSGRVADLLSPLVDHMESTLLASDDVIGIDGTGLKIFASPQCQRRLAYVIHGQGAVVFRMLTGESADQVLEGFEDFHGVVVSDAAKVHLGRHSRSLGLVIALCNAHARRKFYDARETDRARADHAIAFYREVAMRERAWSTLEAPARQRERAEHLRPLFEKYHQWLEEERSRVMPRTPMREAIDYSLNHWSGLTHFLEDGRGPVDEQRERTPSETHRRREEELRLPRQLRGRRARVRAVEPDDELPRERGEPARVPAGHAGGAAHGDARRPRDAHAAGLRRAQEGDRGRERRVSAASHGPSSRSTVTPSLPRTASTSRRARVVSDRKLS